MQPRTPTPELKTQQRPTPTDDRVPFWSKVAYGTGGILDNVMQYGVKSMMKPVLNMTLKMDPVLVGLAMTIPRLWDAVTDPIMGVISDRAQTPWGRRKPFILLGVILSAIFFVLMWYMPKAWSQIGQFSWFLVISLLFYTAYTIFTVPYNALGMELSPDYQERTRILTFRTFFTAVCGFLNQWLLWFCTRREWFENPWEGVKVLSIWIAVAMIFLGVLPVLFTKERIYKPMPRDAKKNRTFWIEFKEALSNKPFKVVLWIVLLVMGGNATVGFFGLYICVYYMFGGLIEKAAYWQGISGTLYNLAYILAAPLLAYTANRWGKKQTLLAFIVVQGIGSVSKWWCYNPDHPWLIVIPSICYGAGYAIVWTLCASMVADICDEDELQYGFRRQGMFSSVFSWCHKTAFSISALGGGILLVLTGFHAELGGNQSKITLMTMRALFAFAPAIFSGIAIVILTKYPITEQRSQETRRLIETGKAGSG